MSLAYHNGRTQSGKVRHSRPSLPSTGTALAAILLPILLGSCENTRSVASDATQIQGFRAGVVADEPRAALIGRTVISGGGNAADGVVAAEAMVELVLVDGVGAPGRQRLMPHMKSYCRYDPASGEVAWFLLTSANFSRAA